MTAPAVPFLDVGATYASLSDEIDEAYRRVMESGWFLLGPELETFESNFAAYSGATACAAPGLLGAFICWSSASGLPDRPIRRPAS